VEKLGQAMHATGSMHACLPPHASSIRGIWEPSSLLSLTQQHAWMADCLIHGFPRTALIEVSLRPESRSLLPCLSVPLLNRGSMCALGWQAAIQER
jgi:hypothetical protein